MNAAVAGIAELSGGCSSCGANSDARTIGPATRCGKNDRYVAKSSGHIGWICPAQMSIT